MSASPPGSASRNWQAVGLPLLVWCAAGAAAAAVGALTGVSLILAGVAFAACVAPALLGFAALPLLRREWVQVVVICVWTALALGAAMTFGATSGAASWFLLPPAMAFLLGRRSLILETGVSSLLALALAAALEAGGLAPPLFPAAQNPLLSAMAVAMAVATVTAIAASVRRQTVLERAAARVRSAQTDDVASQVPAALIRLDGRGVITGAAGAADRVFGMNAAAVEGLSLAALAAREDAAEAVQDAIDEARRSGLETVLDLPLANGVVAELRFVTAGEGVAVLALDVTRRALRERAHMAERDAAMAANEAKSRYLAHMSHEIRTPLNAIIGFSDVMKQRLFGPMPARYAEYADLIQDSGRHLLDLVGDVLDMSKIEADRYDLKLESMDARDVAASTTKLVGLRAEEAGIRLRLDCGLAPLQVRADRRALRQILLNLLSNALKFTPKGGEVRLALRSEAGDLVLEIADTGAGMTEEELARVGAPYQQAGSAGVTAERGSGLGLSLVAALAQLHGGALEVESALGKGTTARVRLPVLEAAPPVRLDARARLQRVADASGEILKVQAEAQA